jgi:hypothetical protein
MEAEAKVDDERMVFRMDLKKWSNDPTLMDICSKSSSDIIPILA